MVVTKLRLELPNIAEVAVYLATQYVQTTTNIVLYGSASIQSSTCPISSWSIDNDDVIVHIILMFQNVAAPLPVGTALLSLNNDDSEIVCTILVSFDIVGSLDDVPDVSGLFLAL